MIEEQNINQLPKDWKRVRLLDVCTKITDGSHFSPKSVSSGFPYVTVRDLKNDKINFESCLTISKSDYESLVQNDCKPLYNDVLFSKDGTVGKVALINFDRDFVVLSSLAILRTDVSKIEPKYLFYVLKSKEFLHQALNQKKGVAIRRIILRDLKELNLNISNLKTQQAIVSKIEELFSEVDKGIEQLKNAQQQLKTYRQAVLKWAFEGKLTASEHAVKTVSFGDVIKVVSGNTPKGLESCKNTGTYQFYKVSDMNLEGNEIEMRTTKLCLTKQEIENFKVKIYPKGTIIFPKRGGAILTNKKRILAFDSSFDLNIMGALPNESIDSKYLYYWFQKLDLSKIYDGSNVPQINNKNIEPLHFEFCSIEEQNRIVQEIESRLSVADKMEESINQSLQQAEALRQSILKKAFEGKLLKEKEEYKPRNVYFYQTQTLGYISYYSSKHKIEHGEMTIAKFAYLLDKIYDVPTYYTYDRWHLGPYPPDMKKVVNNKEFFINNNNGKLELVDTEKIFKYNYPNKEKVASAIDELANIFGVYSKKERSHKTELFATVCKVIEDIQSSDLLLVRQSMKDWKIDLPNSIYKNKAEKFSEEETKKCVEFVIRKGWDMKLMHPS